MDAKSYVTVIIIGILLYFILFGWKHKLDSHILPKTEDLGFYLTNSFQIVESQLLFRYSIKNSNYTQKLHEVEQMCKTHRKSTKLILIQMEDDHVAGGFNIDLCWDNQRPKSQLTPFIFSLKTTERLLFMNQKDGNGHPSAYLFGRTIGLKAKEDGLYGCFSKKFFEAGRFIDWTGKQPGQCFKINQLEVFAVQIQQSWNLKDRIEELTSEDYFNVDDEQQYQDL